MFGPNDPCYPAYTDCLQNSGTGFISTLAYTHLTYSALQPSNPLGICSSICYTCTGVLPDTAPSTTWISPDSKCQTLQYACNQGCNGNGVVPLCMPNYGINTGQAGSVGTCICQSLTTPQINLKPAQNTTGIRICAGGLGRSSNAAWSKTHRGWINRFSVVLSVLIVFIDSWMLGLS
ncbi:hypothetical protein O5D80_006618 [Batrachochytrium dendrobatidis]|nr:hypothetical protein O5D80_006618 [Batrachochytrium dendrobatidis]